MIRLAGLHTTIAGLAVILGFALALSYSGAKRIARRREEVARAALAAAAAQLRAQAVHRFEQYGYADVRGAGLWDAGCHIDPADGDALRLGAKRAER